MRIDDSLAKAIDIAERETAGEARPDEWLRLLPHLSLPLRRLRRERNKDAVSELSDGKPRRVLSLEQSVPARKSL